MYRQLEDFFCPEIFSNELISLLQVLGFDLSSASFLSGLPNLAHLIFAFAFGSLADSITRRNCIGLTRMRKLFCLPCKLADGLGWS